MCQLHHNSSGDQQKSRGSSMTSCGTQEVNIFQNNIIPNASTTTPHAHFWVYKNSNEQTTREVMRRRTSSVSRRPCLVFLPHWLRKRNTAQQCTLLSGGCGNEWSAHNDKRPEQEANNCIIYCVESCFFM